MLSVILITKCFLSILNVGIWERELLSSIILYSFIFGLIIATPFNAVWLRYIADKLFLNKYEDIQPAYYSGLLLISLIGALCGMPFAIWLYWVGDLSTLFILSGYCLFMSILIVFYSITFLASIRSLRMIALQLLGGLLLIAVLGFLIINIIKINIIEGILYALTIGFCFIAANEMAYISKCFHENSGNYKECLSYIIKYKVLFLSNLLYVLGLFSHNVIIWSSRLRVEVVEGLITAPSYDMATYLGLLTNIVTMSIFIVRGEKSYNIKYQDYLNAVFRSTHDRIEKAKNELFCSIVKLFIQVVQVQAMITVVLFLINILVLPMLGISGIILQIYPSLAVAYIVILLMYSNMIIIYNVNDYKGSILVGSVFFTSVLLGTIIFSHFSIRYYGLGVLLGATLGWSLSFFRLHYLEKHFERHVFMQGIILRIKKEELPSGIIFSKNNSLD